MANRKLPNLDYSHTVLELYNYLSEIVPLTENLEKYGIDKSSCPGGEKRVPKDDV